MRTTPSLAAPTESVSDWVDALEETVDLLRTRHPNLFRHQDRQTFRQAVGSARRQIRSASPQHALVKIARVAAAVHDGHTGLPLAAVASSKEAPWNIRLPTTALSLRWFPDGIYVVGGGEAERDLIGGRLERVGRVTAERAFKAAMTCVPGENIWRGRAVAPSLLALPDVVHGLGLHDRPDEIPFVVAMGGSRRHITLQAPEQPAPIVQPAGPASGLHRSSVNAACADLGAGVLYLKYDWCLDQPERPLRDAFAGAFEAIRSRGHQRLIIDLRHNIGGDNRLNWPLIYEIIRTDSINRPGHLFVIIGRDTFSAAMNCVTALERHTAATFVGEPTGAAPNHFGDAVAYHLESTGVQVYISTLWWQESLPDDDRSAVEPHLPVQLTPGDFLAGEDRVLAAIVSGVA